MKRSSGGKCRSVSFENPGGATARAFLPFANATDHAMKILIVKTSAIGDVTHTLPALNALRKRFPGASISWLVEGPSAEIIRGHRALDKVLVCRRKQWAKALLGKGALRAISDVFKFVEMLRADEYDLIVDFQGLLKSAIWVFLARGKRKVGFGPGMQHAEQSHLFYNEKVPAVSMEHHAVDRYLMLLSAIGVPAGEIEFDIPVAPSDRKAVGELLMKNGVGEDDRIVSVNPVARWTTKLWDNAMFAQVADRLVRRGWKVCLTGAESDRGILEDILSCMKENALNLAGETSLKSLAALLERSDAMVTTDTGPMHIAAAMKTPTVALFGPTAPWRTGPYGDGHKVIRVPMDCAPCFRRHCPTVACMAKITPDMVMEGIDELLGSVRE